MFNIDVTLVSPDSVCSPSFYTAFVATLMLAIILSLLLIIVCVLLYRATRRSDGIRGSNRIRVEQPRAEQSPDIGNSADTSMPPATVVEPGQSLPKALSIQPATAVPNPPAQDPPASPPLPSAQASADPVVAVAPMPTSPDPAPSVPGPAPFLSASASASAPSPSPAPGSSIAPAGRQHCQEMLT